MQEVSYNKIRIPIYEYDDAYDCLKELADIYEHDLTPVSRGGRNRNKILYYNYPCAFDIETSTIRPGILGYDDPEGSPLGFGYLFQFNVYGRVIMCRHIEEAMQIFSWIAELFETGAKKRLIFFDHNLAYEYTFFASLWDIDSKASFAMDERHPVTIQLTNGIMIRDSYKMTAMSLDTLSKDWSKRYFKASEIMDYKKLRTPFTELDHDTLLYSALDVLSLSDAIYYYLEARNEKIWTTCPTSTSFIRKALKREVGIGAKKRTKKQLRFFATLEKCRIDIHIYNMLRRQARGGNTHANRAITGRIIGDENTGTGVLPFDVVSEYPAMMVCRPEYPIGHWMRMDDDPDLDDILTFESSGYCCLFDLVLLNPKLKRGITVPYIPTSKRSILKGRARYSDNGRYIDGAEVLKITIYGIELPIILQQYSFTDTVIIDGYFAQKGYLPDIVRRFIIDLYRQKTELKNVPGKDIEYSLSKTYINGIFGMAFSGIIFDNFKITNKGIIKEDLKDPVKELERYQNSTSYFLPYAWGSMTSTLGRIMLQDMIDAVGELHLYNDTDSVYAIEPIEARKRMQKLDAKTRQQNRLCGFELTYYDPQGKPHELGSIEEDPECCFKTWGAKKYVVKRGEGYKSTIAGVPKKAGSALIKSLADFKPGLIFRGEDTGKMCLWYNEDKGIILEDAGRPFRVYSNVAMLPVNYELGISDDYSKCLSVEGWSGLFEYKDINNNVVEEYI